MAAVKAGMERRQKREKRRKLEQKKKSRIRAAQAAAGNPAIYTTAWLFPGDIMCGSAETWTSAAWTAPGNNYGHVHGVVYPCICT